MHAAYLNEGCSLSARRPSPHLLFVPPEPEKDQNPYGGANHSESYFPPASVNNYNLRMRRQTNRIENLTFRTTSSSQKCTLTTSYTYNFTSTANCIIFKVLSKWLDSAGAQFTRKNAHQVILWPQCRCMASVGRLSLRALSLTPDHPHSK